MAIQRRSQLGHFDPAYDVDEANLLTEDSYRGHHGRMRFDLTQMGSREFEHLTQSIAIAEFGPGVGVFGSGADGGREATFDGPVPVSTNGHAWNGYGVIQAKHKEFLGKPKDDASWLIGEINEEMKGWRKRKEVRRRIPEYYIISTNIRISPQDDGGIDRVDACLASHAQSLGFSGWLVWHSDTISTFIANHRDIRMAYASFVTSGDVLSEVLRANEDERQAFSEALTSYTAKELVRQRYVNLDQAGSADDRSVALADIFIDLPYQPWSGREEISSRQPFKLLEYIIRMANSGKQEFVNQNIPVGVDAGRRNYVLVGGPGQGKTTITQFACQMYRAALVADTPAGRFGKIKEACDKIGHLMMQEGIDRPKNRRWPVNIQLTRLADDIAKGETTSLLGYLAKNITNRATIKVEPHQLREWLATYPWFVTLDGLDEVPAASNRREVLALIDDFLIEAASVNADVFVVATTRPQGYTEEFSPAHYKHLQLTPLPREVAMSYGKRLAVARHGNESDRTDRLIERLERATYESATSRLMTTPLQVTILAVLLERVGQAPKDRYNLFADYYQVIYQRELEKDSKASALLRDRQSDVDTIHAKVGLLLQTRSEHSGETHSTLSEEELGHIVRDRLEKEGHKGKALDTLCEQVIKAATDRLVFLVSTRSDEIGFEIRSLQEFWAAQGIMQGTEPQIAENLRRIASSAHWRNTLLFAVGHIFSIRETLRDTVVSLVTQLNSHSIEHGEINKAVLAGSRLAVSVLSDGMVRSPNYLESLTDQALKLFELPPDRDVRAVANCIPSEMLEAVFSFVDARKELRIRADDLSLVYALCALAERSDLSTADRIESARSASFLYSRLPDQGRWDLLYFAHQSGNKHLLSLTQNCLVEAPLSQVIEAVAGPNDALARQGASPLRDDEAPLWVEALRDSIRQRQMQKKSRAREESLGFDGELPSLRDRQLVWQRLTESNPPRRTLLHDLAEFGARPGSESLALFLKAASKRPNEIAALAGLLPWVVTQVLAETSDLESAAQAVEAGNFGDLSDWVDLEIEWDGPFSYHSMLGSMQDYFSSGRKFYPLAASHGVFRIPESPTSGEVSLVRSIFNDYDRLEFGAPGLKTFFASWLLTMLFVVGHADENVVDSIGPDSLRLVVEDAAAGRYFSCGWVEYLPVENLEHWSDCLHFIGTNLKMIHGALDGAQIQRLLDIWKESPEQWGLARIAVSGQIDILSSVRSPGYWQRDCQPGALGEEATVMPLLVSAVLGFPPSKSEALAASSRIVETLDSHMAFLTREALRKMDPGVTQESRLLYLKCAEGAKGETTLRVRLYERLVEVLGQDPSGMEAP
ncbi:NACHT domain-containing protein [Streptomyces zhihengii]|uniref:NACHT domain-containing protein n=1 Tax=Streptomyces zhihengii TaxID=1818004 RepID=UPI00367A6C45